jgi:hypothetical protein
LAVECRASSGRELNGPLAEMNILIGIR